MPCACTAFIHASTSAGPSLQTTTTDAEPHMNRDKRRRVEESLSLVEDPASRSGSAFDALLAPRPGSTVSVEWGQVAYITVRDQVRTTQNISTAKPIVTFLRYRAMHSSSHLSCKAHFGR